MKKFYLASVLFMALSFGVAQQYQYGYLTDASNPQLERVLVIWADESGVEFWDAWEGAYEGILGEPFTGSDFYGRATLTNALGRQGWQLISFTEDPDGGARDYIFMREVSE